MMPAYYNLLPRRFNGLYDAAYVKSFFSFIQWIKQFTVANELAECPGTGQGKTQGRDKIIFRKKEKHQCGCYVKQGGNFQKPQKSERPHREFVHGSVMTVPVIFSGQFHCHLCGFGRTCKPGAVSLDQFMCSM